MKFSYLIETKNIAYVSNVVESYEDVALMSTIRKINNNSLVLFRVADDFIEVFNRIISSLREEKISIEEFKENF